MQALGMSTGGEETTALIEDGAQLLQQLQWAAVGSGIHWAAAAAVRLRAIACPEQLLDTARAAEVPGRLVAMI